MISGVIEVNLFARIHLIFGQHFATILINIINDTNTSSGYPEEAPR